MNETTTTTWATENVAGKEPSMAANLANFLPHHVDHYGLETAEAECRATFERVQNPENWKKAVSGVAFAHLPTMAEAVSRIVLAAEAVVFFTGSVPEVRVVPEHGGGWAVVVKAPGYYAAIGA